MELLEIKIVLKVRQTTDFTFLPSAVPKIRSLSLEEEEEESAEKSEEPAESKTPVAEEHPAIPHTEEEEIDDEKEEERELERQIRRRGTLKSSNSSSTDSNDSPLSAGSSDTG